MVNAADPKPFIDHPSFHEPSAGRQYGGALPPLPPATCFSVYENRHVEKVAPLPHDTLTLAFLRYNYARFRASTPGRECDRLRWARRAAFCREYIARHNLALVWLVIRQYKAPWTQNFDKDELQSFGNAGLAQAIDGFDASLGWRFASYAYPAILREIQKACQQESIRRRNLPSRSLTTPFPGRDEDDDQLDRSAGVAQRRWQDVVAQGLAREEIEYAMQHAALTDRERMVITRRFGLDGLSKSGDSAATIASDLGLSSQTIRTNVANALVKMRRVLRRAA